MQFSAHSASAIEHRKVIEQCVGVFVSRFDPKTSEKDIVETIREQTGLKVEKMQSKYDTTHLFAFVVLHA